MRTVGFILVIALSTFGLHGCLLLVAGAAAEAGYLAGQDQSAGTTISDQWITAKVKTKLIADDLVKARNVNVDTSDGVVTLRGIVFSSQQEARAILLARETKGVKKVISHLKISRKIRRARDPVDPKAPRSPPSPLAPARRSPASETAAAAA